MDLVNKQNGGTVAVKLFQQVFEPLLKIAAVLVPATMDAISSASTRLPFKLGVTCPAAMRWARASARALLPTPAPPKGMGYSFGGGTKFRSCVPAHHPGKVRGPAGLPAQGGSGHGHISHWGGCRGYCSCGGCWAKPADRKAGGIPARRVELPAQGPPATRWPCRRYLPAWHRAGVRSPLCSRGQHGPPEQRIPAPCGFRAQGPGRAGAAGARAGPLGGTGRKCRYCDLFAAQKLHRSAPPGLQHGKQQVPGIHRRTPLPACDGDRGGDGAPCGAG